MHVATRQTIFGLTCFAGAARHGVVTPVVIPRLHLEAMTTLCLYGGWPFSLHTLAFGTRPYILNRRTCLPLPGQMDSLRGSCAKLGTMRRILAWPLRKDDTHKSKSITKSPLPGQKLHEVCLNGILHVMQYIATERERERERERLLVWLFVKSYRCAAVLPGQKLHEVRGRFSQMHQHLIQALGDETGPEIKKEARGTHVCVYTYTYIYIYICICMYIHIYIHRCVCIYTYIHYIHIIHISLSIYIYICYIYIERDICIGIYMYIYICICLHLYIHVCIRMYVCM